MNVEKLAGSLGSNPVEGFILPGELEPDKQGRRDRS